MIVFHGSNMIVDRPDIEHSKKYLDFGKGFYVTTYRNQAEKWAKRKALRTGKKSFVCEYAMSEDMSNLMIKNFMGKDEEWLDFICDCRNGAEEYKQYDIIIGNVADDDVFKTVDLYLRGIWTKEKAVEELKYYKDNNQIAFISQKAIDELLVFQSSYQVV